MTKMAMVTTTIILLAITLASVSAGCCYSNCTRCRTNCPYPNPAADMIGYVTRCSSLFAIIDYGFGCYPVISCEYDWFVGQKANLNFYKTYAYIFKIRSKYYYISVVGQGCPSLVRLTDSNTTAIPSTFITHHRATIIVTRFDSTYEGGCTVFTHPSTTIPNRQSCCYGDNDDVPSAVYQLGTTPAVSYASPSSRNNANYSYLENDIVKAHGLPLARTAQGPNQFYPEDYLEFFEYLPLTCGSPGVCKRLNRITDIEVMIREAGYDISCIDPANSNSGCILSEAISQALTITAVPTVFTSIVMSIVVPPGCNGFTYLRLAGPIYTDSFQIFYLKLFQLCY